MRRHRHRTPIQPILALLVLALPNAAAAAQRPTSRDSAGITIVTSSAPLWTPAQALRIDEAPQLIIGTQPGTQYELARVAGAVRLSDGRTAVADGASLELRFYDPRGTFTKAVGGRGAGPGEFRRIDDLAISRGDTLALRGDRGKVAYFDGNGTLLFVANHTIAPELRAGARPQIMEVLATFPDGSAIVGTFGNPAPRPGVARWIETFPVKLVDRRNALVRSLGDLPMSAVATDDVGPRPPWFAAPLSMAHSDDAFYIGLGTEYSIRAYDRAGRLTRIIRRQWTPVKVTERDIDTYVVEWGKRWIRSTGAEAERERVDLRNDPYEATVPAYSRFIADRTGRLWVRTPNLADAPRAGALNDSPLVPSVNVANRHFGVRGATFDVFAPDGGYMGQVIAPSDTRFFAAHADVVMGFRYGDDGVSVAAWHVGVEPAAPSR